MTAQERQQILEEKEELILQLQKTQNKLNQVTQKKYITNSLNNTELGKENEVLKKENSELGGKVSFLQEENVELKDKNSELEMKVNLLQDDVKKLTIACNDLHNILGQIVDAQSSRNSDGRASLSTSEMDLLLIQSTDDLQRTPVPEGAEHPAPSSDIELSQEFTFISKPEENKLENTLAKL